MSEWTRRKALGGIASAAALAAFDLGCSSRRTGLRSRTAQISTPITQLNVLLHGLMVLEVTPSNVILTLPDVCGDAAQPSHAYKAGGLDLSSSTPSDRLRDLYEGRTYTLSGVDSINNPKPVFSSVVNFIPDNPRKTLSVNRANRRTIVLPWPLQTYSLAVKCRNDRQPFLTTPFGPGNAALSTIQLLTYGVSTGSPTVKDDNGVSLAWLPTDELSHGCANLHFFAEPKMAANGPHAVFAFDEMMLHILDNGVPLYGKYKFNSFDPTQLGSCASDPTLCGITRSDLQPLSTVMLKHGGEVANCTKAIIDMT